MSMACAHTSGMHVCNGHAHGLHVCVRAMCELRLCGGAAACMWGNIVAPIAFHTRSMSIVTCHHGSRTSHLAYYGSTHPGAHLLPLRARHGQRPAPWPPATAWRLLGRLLCRGSADAPAPYAAEGRVGAGVPPKPREADAPQCAHAQGCRCCTVLPQRSAVEAGADAVARHTRSGGPA